MAFHVEDATTVERLVVDAGRHGWRLLFPDQHPHAGFEVELVAVTPGEHG